MLDRAAAIRILTGRTILISGQACAFCGAQQIDKHTNACIGCELEAALGMNYDNLCDLLWIGVTTETGHRYINVSEYHNDKRRGNRQQEHALRSGWTYYHGQACDKCGCNLRRANSGNCVGCVALNARFRCNLGDQQKISKHRSRGIVEGRSLPTLTLHVDRIMRQTASEMQLGTYHGMPCKNCSGTKRYTLRGQCVACVKGRNRNKKPAPAQTGAGDEFAGLFE